MSAPGAAMPVLPSLVSTSSMAVTTLFTVLATAAVGLRLWARKMVSTHSWFGADDYVIIVALFFAWGLFVTAIVGAAGAGINTMQGDLMSDGVLLLKIFFIEPLFEFPGQALTRISVLLFYKRLFIVPTFQRTCDVMIFVIASWAFSAVITDLTGIRPTYMAWNPASKYDIDFGAYSIAIGAIGIAIDLITLSVPLPVIHGLHMRTANKIFTVGILWLGLFCVVADSVRLYYTVVEVGLAVTDVGPDRYLVGRSVWLWDRIAPCSSIIAVCLPTYGPLVHARKLESAIRSAASWFSAHSPRGTPQRSDTGEDAPPKSLRGSDSLHHHTSEEQLPGDTRSGSQAHATAENYPLHDLAGVKVTSTVDLEYSQPSGTHTAEV